MEDWYWSSGSETVFANLEFEIPSPNDVDNVEVSVQWRIVSLLGQQLTHWDGENFVIYQHVGLVTPYFAIWDGYKNYYGYQKMASGSYTVDMKATITDTSPYFAGCVGKTM